MQYQQILMNQIVYAGEVRSHCMKALQAVRLHHYEEAERLLQKADDSLLKACQLQENIVKGSQANGIDLLLLHAQDHLMSATVLKDTIYEFILIFKERE